MVQEKKNILGSNFKVLINPIVKQMSIQYSLCTPYVFTKSVVTFELILSLLKQINIYHFA